MRFEMPFAVWCTTCKPHETLIGQGVRFNAEKKKVGAYYSTPVYSFRMRHPACGGWIEIRTDPKNTAYVVTEGGRKRETGVDVPIPGTGTGAGEIAVAVGDPFAKIEGKDEDKRVFDEEKSRIWELQRRQERDWDDPYEKSRRLRKRFRTERKGLEADDARREALKDKMSLGIELVDETEEDRARAGMVDFGADADGTARLARSRPLFESRTPSSAEKKPGKRSKTADLLAQRKTSFRNELAGNTRAIVDPFLNDGPVWQPGIKKRKTVNKSPAVRDVRNEPGELNDANNTPLPDESRGNAQKTPTLVGYESDST